MSAVRIPPDVREILHKIDCDGPRAKIVEQLDRAMYQKVAKVLAALGGKWNRSAQATVFPEDAGPLIADCAAAGEYVDAKKQFQFYETPRDVVNMMLDVAGVQLTGKCVLEPSAGNGAIADAALNRGAIVDCVELHTGRAEQLFGRFNRVCCADFLNLTTDTLGPYDLVLMNPPFTRSQDILHVTHAFSFLKPAGLLVAVMSPGFTFRNDSRARDFRHLVRDCGSFMELPDKSFKTSGTTVRTVLVTLRK